MPHTRKLEILPHVPPTHATIFLSNHLGVFALPPLYAKYLTKANTFYLGRFEGFCPEPRCKPHNLSITKQRKPLSPSTRYKRTMKKPLTPLFVTQQPIYPNASIYMGICKGENRWLQINFWTVSMLLLVLRLFADFTHHGRWGLGTGVGKPSKRAFRRGIAQEGWLIYIGYPRSPWITLDGSLWPIPFQNTPVVRLSNI